MPLLAVIYLAFISLGLPDSLLGSAWPSMYPTLDASVSQGGFLSMTTCLCTIISALGVDSLARRIGTGALTLGSVTLTALALFGYSRCTTFWQLFIWAIPYGLGAGGVDAALNAYVSLHYEARHMNWLHCMWGIGASTGPIIMGWQLSGAGGWQGGYLVVSLLQWFLVGILFTSLGTWDNPSSEINTSTTKTPRLTRAEAMQRPGLYQALIGFFCYCALESTCGLWAASFMVIAKGISNNDAALFASIFFIGITLGRAVSGFLTLRFNGHQLQHMGEALIALGVITMLFARSSLMIGIGLVLIGFGCAPIYPQMIQLTPARFGADAAEALMGLQMGAAYIGSLIFPPLAGLILEHVSAALFPFLIGGLVIVMTLALNSCDAKAASFQMPKASSDCE